MSVVGQTLYIGLPTAANDAPPSEIARLGLGDVPTTGVQYPPTTGDETWTLYAAAGAYGSTDAIPAGAISQPFTAVSIGVLPATAITNIHFVENPSTGDLIDYASVGNGQYDCVPHEIQWTQPDLSADSDYWFSFLTVQKGRSLTGIGTVTGTTNFEATAPVFAPAQVGYVLHVNGIWNTIAAYIDSTHVTLSTPASNGTGLAYELWDRAVLLDGSPDWEGVNSDPNLTAPYDISMVGVVFFGRKFTDSGELQGGNSVPGTTVQYFGGSPPDWSYPPPLNADGSVNVYRTYRYLLYAVSRRGTRVDGGTGVFTLQTWLDGTDHGDLTPAVQIPSLDLTQAAPASYDQNNFTKDPATNKFKVALNGIAEPNLSPGAVSARTMAQNAITQANGAVAYNAIVDANIATVGISKLGAGTTITNGTAIFTADVVLSRGSGNPVIVLANNASTTPGVYLYGVAGPDGKGLTTQPYVVVQNTGVLVATGTGPSIQLSGVGAGAVYLWSKNGDASKAYVVIDSNNGMGIAAPDSLGKWYRTQVSAQGKIGRASCRERV